MRARPTPPHGGRLLSGRPASDGTVARRGGHSGAAAAAVPRRGRGLSPLPCSGTLDDDSRPPGMLTGRPPPEAPRLALVTGAGGAIYAGGAIGSAIARALRAKGQHVAPTDRDPGVMALAERLGPPAPNHVRDITDSAALPDLVATVAAGTGRTADGTSKAALTHPTRQAAPELDPMGINGNAVAPGPVASVLADAVQPPETVAGYRSPIMQGRHGQPEDIAAVATFPCGHGASNLVGQILAVDGGQTAAAVDVPAARSAARPSAAGIAIQRGGDPA